MNHRLAPCIVLPALFSQFSFYPLVYGIGLFACNGFFLSAPAVHFQAGQDQSFQQRLIFFVVEAAEQEQYFFCRAPAVKIAGKELAYFFMFAQVSDD